MRFYRTRLAATAAITFAIAGCASQDVVQSNFDVDRGVAVQGARLSLVPTSGLTAQMKTAMPSGLCWDVTGSTRVMLRTCNATAASQQFTLLSNGELHFTDRCLVPWGDYGIDGDILTTYICGGRTSVWTYTSAGEIRSFNNKCLQTQLKGNAGDLVILMPCTGGTNQKWHNAGLLTPAAPVAAVGVSLVGALTAGTQAQAGFEPRDANGQPLSDRLATWTSSDNAVATVTSTGVVTAVAPGTVVITATVENISGSASTTVSQAPEGTLTGGVAGAMKSRLSSSLCWDATGTTRIALRTCVPGLPAQEYILVANGELHYTDRCLVPWGDYGVDGDVLTTYICGGRTSKWTFSAAGEIRSFNDKCLQLSGSGNPGELTILMPCTGALNQKWTSVPTVATPVPVPVPVPAPVPVASVSVSVAASSILPGVQTQATAVVRDANNAVLTGRALAWTSSNPAVATITPAGLVTAVSVGSVQLTATSEGKAGSAPLTVTAPPPPVPAAVASIGVTLGAVSIVTGTQTQATAILRDASNLVLTGRPVTWSSSNPAVASVSSTGLVTGLTAGSASIVAMAEGKSASASLLVTAPVPVGGGQTGYFVATTGSPLGDGSLARPWDIATALAHPARVQAGDTLWIRGGTYRGQYTSYLHGQAGRLVVLRQYPGERATIDGGLAVRGAYSAFWGFEVMNSDLGALVTAVDVFGVGSKIINMVVHDAAGNGIGLWEGANDAELYGNVLFNVGRAGSSAGRYAHGIYFQNVTAGKRLIDNIVANSYSYNFHGYTENAGLNNLYLEGNVSFNAGSFVTYGGAEYLVGGGQPVRNLMFTGNYSYRGGGLNARNEFGYGAPSPVGNVLSNNYLAGATKFSYLDGLTFTGNTLVNAQREMIEIYQNSNQSLGSGFVFANNTYRAPFANDIAAFRRVSGSGTGFSLAQWQGFGYDLNSDFKVAPASGMKIVVRANQYEPGRANVVVYNWDHAGSASVNLSGVLAPGDRYEVREVQDYYGAVVASGTFGGGSLSLPMTTVTAVRPLGSINTPAPSTGTEFHTFVVLRKP